MKRITLLTGFLLTLYFLNSCSYSPDKSVTQGKLVFPNAFSPAYGNFVGNGEKVKTIHLKIYNRLGQIVYKSDSWSEIQNVGWDGKVDGILQSSESYVWYVSGKFEDGRDLKTIEGRQTGTVLLFN